MRARGAEAGPGRGAAGSNTATVAPRPRPSIPIRSHKQEETPAAKLTPDEAARLAKLEPIIDKLYPHGRRIELFCRGTAPPGWAALGNEVGGPA
jgi:hypothetical protein